MSKSSEDVVEKIPEIAKNFVINFRKQLPEIPQTVSDIFFPIRGAKLYLKSSFFSEFLLKLLRIAIQF